MPYITREDGEHFVIPSYRDILSAKSKSALKKEVVSLSQNYGEYITMQRKAPLQYEVAFSPDTGYLLGESAWQHFERPSDMIYCEAISGTSEAILVIVKNGSVYLDGSFPIDSIPEELVIFLTQQNNFDIFIYGDVPLSQKPEEGKFSFEESSVNSFTILDKPVFNSLPLLRQYHFQLVEPVLKAHGIGAVPIAPIIGVVIALVVGWMFISFLTKEEPKPVVVVEKNPYEAYVSVLQSPDPSLEIKEVVNAMRIFSTIPGWIMVGISDLNETAYGSMLSLGTSVEDLMQWANENDIGFTITSKGVVISKKLDLKKRPKIKVIYPQKEVLAKLIDNISKVYPGNLLKLSKETRKGKFTQIEVTITLKEVSPVILNLLADALEGLPINLNFFELKVRNGKLDGSIKLLVLGT